MGKWCSFLIESSSKLLVTRTGIKAWTSLISGRIRILTLELLALWMTKILHFQTWISLKPVGQSWSNFMCSIIGKMISTFSWLFFIQPFWKDKIWPWHIGLRWAIVALWATCFRCEIQYLACKNIPEQNIMGVKYHTWKPFGVTF